ncbi:MAG: ABC transporter permease [Pseudomonadota bacterium]|uniref:MlaE family ABC transporter permease n=1 Tax=Polaromonas sp. TaxID=1869339 RepID=UPI001821C53C|nr:ABC transporter permease [Polaromonas sp.]MBA3593303.1 ABC transporter permease [Polaromonas sp.]MDQ3270921.1 ABC transporter permease [Pseudomonadota bacterium]
MSSPEEKAAGESAPHIDVQEAPEGASCLVLGFWTGGELTARPVWDALTASLKAQGSEAGRGVVWDLRQMDQLDHLGAQVLWNHWGRQWPEKIEVEDAQRAVLERVAEFSVDRPATPAPGFKQAFLNLGEGLIEVFHHFTDLVALVGRLMLNLGKLARRPGDGPWRDLSGHLYHIGATALPITALVGFLIGVVLAYLISQQLKQFGADAFIVDILGISLIRELGPVLAAILIAGRSGSAITAQIGVMRVTEELDAMRVMGIAHSYRLVMPRALALAVVMPLISAWTTVAALIGGMLAADLAMGITPSFFINALPAAVDASNLTLATAKSVVFGVLIALIGCHFGLRVKPNTESLGQGTTASVVTSITVVILVDALFAVLFKNIGI